LHDQHTIEIYTLSLHDALPIFNGTIRGRVSDPSDQPVAGSNVTAVNNATGYTRSIASAEDGYYVIASLPIGTYTVTITKNGSERSEETRLNSSHVAISYAVFCL